MEGYFTDAIYIRRAAGKSPELELREKHLYAQLAARISGEEYLRIEKKRFIFS